MTEYNHDNNVIVAQVLITALGGDVEKDIDGTEYNLSLFGFIYGTFPTAPGVCLTASIHCM